MTLRRRAGAIGRRFRLGLVINTAFTFFELAAALVFGSLTLLADAIHNLSDSLTLVISWLGDRIAQKPADAGHTLGHGRIQVMSAFMNSLILVAAAVFIATEAYRRLTNPLPISGGVVAIVASIGILANGLTALIFWPERRDLNVRAAYINMLFDTLFSVAAVVSGLIILKTGLAIIDPIMSFLIAGGLLFVTYGLVKEAVNIFLEGVPKGVSVHQIHQTIQADDGVTKVSRLHIWALSSNEYALSCQIVPTAHSLGKIEEITARVKGQLKPFGITDAVVEIGESEA